MNTVGSNDVLSSLNKKLFQGHKNGMFSLKKRVNLGCVIKPVLGNMLYKIMDTMKNMHLLYIHF